MSFYFRNGHLEPIYLPYQSFLAVFLFRQIVTQPPQTNQVLNALPVTPLCSLRRPRQPHE
jgi:hypothetical protein